MFKFQNEAVAIALLITFKDKYSLMILHEGFEIENIIHELSHFDLQKLGLFSW